MENSKKRVLLKVSGEKLAYEGKLFHIGVLEKLAKDIKQAHSYGWEVAVLVGGGNILRGREADTVGMARVSADYAGMMATMINGLVIKEAFHNCGLKSNIYSFIDIPNVCQKFTADIASQSLQENGVVILAGGTGNPFFTTDTAACLRAAELNIPIVLKGTKVKGVFSSDPMVDKEAVFYSSITYDECLSGKLDIMDSTAICLARESGLDLTIFDLDEPEAIVKAINHSIGTLITEKTKVIEENIKDN